MASSSASWRLNKPPSSFVSGHKSTMCSMVCCSPNHRVQMRHVSTTWALACAETVQQCPGMAQQVKARLLDSRVAYKMTTDHSSRQPVFFPRRTLADRICVCPDRASSYKSFCGCQTHRHTEASLGGRPRCYRAVCLWLTYDVEPEEQYWPAQIATGSA